VIDLSKIVHSNPNLSIGKIKPKTNTLSQSEKDGLFWDAIRAYLGLDPLDYASHAATKKARTKREKKNEENQEAAE
jgi:hypothetical protein